MTKKISQLPAATSVDTNDEFVINQDGTTKKLTTANPWQFSDVNIDGGNIDGTAIGASSASSGAFTTLTASDDVNFDSGTLFVDASTNNVGIGTDEPEASLSFSTPIFSSSSTSGTIKFQDPQTAHDAYIQSFSLSGQGSSIALGSNFSLNTTGLFEAIDGSSESSGMVVDRRGILTFWTDLSGSPAERMRIDSSGHAIIPAGVTLGTSAGVYNAANTLDDYEEGTWTPAFQASGLSVTYTSQIGTYTKVGNIVTCIGSIVVNTASGGSVILRISGQPFASNNDERLNVARFENWNSAAPKRGNASGSNSVNLRLDSTATGTENFPPSNLAAGSFLQFILTYTVS